MDLVTTITTFSHIANSQVVWSILCILLAVYVLRESKKEKERLIKNLESLTKSQAAQANTMKNLCDTLAEMKYTNDRLERIIYRYTNLEVNNYEN